MRPTDPTERRRSLRYVAAKYAEHRLSAGWLHSAWHDGRLRRMAGREG